MDFCWQGLRSVEVEVRNGQDSTRGPEIGSVDRAVTELFDVSCLFCVSFFFLPINDFYDIRTLGSLFFSQLSSTFPQFPHQNNDSVLTCTYQDKIEEMEKRLAQAGKDKSEVVP